MADECADRRADADTRPPVPNDKYWDCATKSIVSCYYYDTAMKEWVVRSEARGGGVLARRPVCTDKASAQSSAAALYWNDSSYERRYGLTTHGAGYYDNDDDYY